MNPIGLPNYLEQPLNRLVTAGSNAAYSMTDLFIRYVAGPVESYLIGDLRNDAPFIPGSNTGFEIRSFGLLGHVAMWQPKTREAMAEVLNELDTQPYARSCYRSAEILVGSSPFLLADTTVFAPAHRKEAIRFLTPKRFIPITWALWKKHDSLDGLNENSIPMEAIAKGLLGIELSQDNWESLKGLTKEFKKYSTIPLSPNLLKLYPPFRAARAKYQKCIEDLLQKEIGKIKNTDLKIIEEDNGLLVHAIAKKLLENPNTQDLHKDPELKSLILFFLAVDNLESAINTMHIYLPRYFEKVEQEVESANLLQDGETINPDVLLGNKTMPSLDRIYRESVHNSGLGGSIVARYVQNGILCEEHEVPPGTYLAISVPSENPSPVDVFSAGRRSCPAMRISEAIFKTIAVAKILQISKFLKNKHPDDRPKYLGFICSLGLKTFKALALQ